MSKPAARDQGRRRQMSVGGAIADGLKGVYVIATEENMAELYRRNPNRLGDMQQYHSSQRSRTGRGETPGPVE